MRRGIASNVLNDYQTHKLRELIGITEPVGLDGALYGKVELACHNMKIKNVLPKDAK